MIHNYLQPSSKIAVTIWSEKKIRNKFFFKLPYFHDFIAKTGGDRSKIFFFSTKRAKNSSNIMAEIFKIFQKNLLRPGNDIAVLFIHLLHFARGILNSSRDRTTVPRIFSKIRGAVRFENANELRMSARGAKILQRQLFARNTQAYFRPKSLAFFVNYSATGAIFNESWSALLFYFQCQIIYYFEYSREIFFILKFYDGGVRGLWFNKCQQNVVPCSTIF